ncbi:MAG: DUF4145 domain-containing protein [Chloroflexi bacterium]|nr:DUF4145 domain-containing protein [Chloroflexota bacterium]MCI0645413.1 DUF4145 domain-containing protein [Chloroflexota bacterium]MCI0731279.1 DUF4145 domain-containing protein [Chloroflexota bacterium]
MNRKVTLTLDKTKDKQYWLPCSQCATQTVHKVIMSAESEDRLDRTYEEEEDEEDQWYVRWDRYEIVECQGCKLLAVRRETMDEDGWPGSDDSITTRSEGLYPSRIAGRRQLPYIDLTPQKISEIYKETHAALSHNMLVLAGIGIRAMVETVCKDKGAKGRSLATKIDNLVQQGVLTGQGAEILHSLRLMGNKAAHEVTPHSRGDLAIAFDVIENLLNSVYILPFFAARLPKRNESNA